MTNKRFIVLLSGWTTSGKDLFADILVKKANFKKLAFALPLKKHTSEKYNFDYNLTLTQKGKTSLVNFIKDGINKNETVRYLLIKEAKLGKETDGINVWSEKLVDELLFYDKINDKRGETIGNIVISDFRYPHEIDYLKSKFNEIDTKIITIRINRHKICPITSDSEHELDNYQFDYTIDNDKSIKEFEINIVNMFYFLFD